MSLKDILCDTEFPYERDSDDDRTIFLNCRFLGMQKPLRQKTGKSFKMLVGNPVLKEGGLRTAASIFQRVGATSPRRLKHSRMLHYENM